MSHKERICYAVVATKGATGPGLGPEIIAEYPTNEKELAETCKRVVANIKSSTDYRDTSKWDRYNIHVKVARGNIYVCAAGEMYQLRICSAFLDDIQRAVESNERNLKATLKSKMTYYNDPSNDKALKVQQQIDEVKDIMTDNIDKVIKRGDDLAAINAKAQDLEMASKDFQRTAVKVKRNMCAQHIKLIIIIVALILGAAVVALIVIVSAVCGSIGCK